MSNYSKTTDFAAKDSLPSGDSGKIIRGSEFETEFDAISTAIATKADAADPTFTGTVTIDGLTVNGNTTLGNAATDTVTVTADIASNLIPSADDTYNLGASGAEWNDLYVDGTAHIDAINFNGTAITATGAEINYLDITTLGTVEASKAVTADSGGHVTFPDDNQLRMGASDDLKIYHNSSNGNSIIAETGSGALSLHTNGSEINFYDSGNTRQLASFTTAGATTLRHNGDIKFSTASTGVDVTGTVTADGALIESVSDTQLRISDSTSTNQRLDLRTNAGVSKIIAGNNQAFGDLRIQAFDGTSEINRLRIQPSGDVSFYEDTGTTAKFFWDASAESLGIGTTSPATTLHVQGGVQGGDQAIIESTNGGAASGPQLNLKRSSASPADNDPIGMLKFTGNNSALAEHEFARIAAVMDDVTDTTEDGSLLFSTSSAGSISERVRIDSSGNVGIGTSSPGSALEVVGRIATSGGSADIQSNLFGAGDGSATNPSIRNTGDSDTGFWFPAANTIGFSTAGSEAMRIDSSGNLLVGKTSGNTLGTPGVEIDGNLNRIMVTRDDQVPLFLNRNSTDGIIQEFRKDNSTVGTIGSNNARFYIHNNYGVGSGFRFDNGSINPSTSAGASEDATTDLGASAARFKDLYLSGNAYIGNAVTSGTNGSTSLVLEGAAHIFRKGSAGSYAEYGRFDSSGNFLIGKASSGTNNVGSQISGDGYAAIVNTSNNIPLYLENKATGGNCRISFTNDSHGGASFGLNNGGDFTIFDTTASTTRFNVTSAKILTASGGLGGIQLGGTTAANTLDDYEEGGWTPVLADATTGGNTATAGTAVGRYTKVGRMVTVDCYLTNVNTTGLVAGQGVFIRDLPFTAQGATYAIGAVESNDVTFSGNIIARVDNSGTYARLLDNASGASANVVTVSDLTSGAADIIFSVTYQAA